MIILFAFILLCSVWLCRNEIHRGATFTTNSLLFFTHENSSRIVPPEIKKMMKRKSVVLKLTM